jgi:hypothetical protein
MLHAAADVDDAMAVDQTVSTTSNTTTFKSYASPTAKRLALPSVNSAERALAHYLQRLIHLFLLDGDDDQPDSEQQDLQLHAHPDLRALLDSFQSDAAYPVLYVLRGM